MNIEMLVRGLTKIAGIEHVHILTMIGKCNVKYDVRLIHYA